MFAHPVHNTQGQLSSFSLIAQNSMKTFGVALLAAILGYVVGLFGTMAAIELFSSNTHDKSMEAAMTGAFVGGPLIAVISVIAILALRRKRSS
jgi:predicted peroxiredoxin